MNTHARTHLGGSRAVRMRKMRLSMSSETLANYASTSSTKIAQCQAASLQVTTAQTPSQFSVRMRTRSQSVQGAIPIAEFMSRMFKVFCGNLKGGKCRQCARCNARTNY